MFPGEHMLSIFAINALDCYHLGLIDESCISDYLKKLNALKKPVDLNSINKVTREWSLLAVDLDKRGKVEFKGNDWRNYNSSFAIVMSFTSFVSRFNGIALKTRPPRISLERYLEKITTKKIQSWVGKISILANKGHPLVLNPVRHMWCAPEGREDDLKMNVEKYRSKLGLVHLPFQTGIVGRTLVRLSIPINEFSKSEWIFKRPCLLDGPGSRFRALTISELAVACHKANNYGYTVDLESSSYNDGFRELILMPSKLLSGNLLLKKWKIELIDGVLDEIYSDADIAHDANFSKELFKYRPNNTSVCAYRRDPNGIENEYNRLVK